ncbi:sensor domain-containing diguanylate cyclase [Goodfellowiella coeruleoviolacea]|uniref:Diguanylate cyclase (GGDEF) domain-containing protein n=1 Tax=Goodfellowiella coeruleoviolacea TaxID=334858 RepID=A0AAE3GIQ1_9PSEU|nr:GGDEF domain-containing protein [Goodfellowiella coeruleoviolacea]MCP2168926.1 diguanylate cyclase (GGDEF) domain-containing protein [Goodfellowiella coeruleoviolacea]
MRDWPMWTLRRSALLYWLAIDAAALGVVGYVLVSTPEPPVFQVHRFAAIGGTAIVVVIMTALTNQRGEPQRNPWPVHVCYLCAGIVALPVNLLVLLLFGPALHGVLGGRPEPHRWVFTLSATALAAFISRAVVGWSAPVLDPCDMVSGAAVFLVCRAVLVTVGLWLRQPSTRWDEVIGERVDIMLGVVAACTGGLMGCVTLGHAWQALIAGPPMILLERAAQLPQWRRSAQRDAKTGLANARHWEARARYELARTQGRRRPVALLLIDLDHFKRVNDRVGHLAGDAALAGVAMLMRRIVRGADLVGRFGGEEFVVLLPETEPYQAEAVAQRIRLAVTALRVPTVDTEARPHLLSGLTVSIGVATSERFGYDLDSLLVAADAAMLAAKNYGRNQVEMA